jgi:hypothetical protein
MKRLFDDEGQVWISVPLSRETAARLSNLSDICHADRVSVAASLLHDVLMDDIEAHPLESLPVLGCA